MTPQPLPLTAYCAAGHAAESIAHHETTLVGLHEAGRLRLIDTGREEGAALSRRWRVTWGQGSAAVRAALGIAEPATGTDEVTFWLYAEAKRPWSIREQRSPVERMGLLDRGLKDPSSAYSLTQQNPLIGLDDVGFLEHTFNQGMRDSPVLVYNDQPGARFNHEMLRFRNATRGLCGLLPIDDSGRQRLNRLLPADRRVPHRAVRLYLPPWWVGHLDDIVVPADRLSRPGEWRRIVETVLRVSSWRPGGKVPATAETWDALINNPMRDRRVIPSIRGGNLHWLPSADDAGADVLRKRLHEAAGQTSDLRAETDRVRIHLEERTAELDELRARRERAHRSRRRLAGLTRTFRQERDRTEESLRRGSVGEAWREAREAALEAALYAEELDRVDAEIRRLRHAVAAADGDPTPPAAPPGSAVPPEPRPEPPAFARFAELLDAARGLTGIRLGPGVSADDLDGHQRTAQWLRRTWDVLELLDSYARARRGAIDTSAPALRGFAHYVREHGGSRGLSPAHVASGESELVVNTPRYRNARTFPVPREVHADGWGFFGAHVKIDRGGGVAPRLHYLDDTRGATGVVHVGYLGPHLPSPESN